MTGRQRRRRRMRDALNLRMMLVMMTLCVGACSAAPSPVVKADAICAAISQHHFTAKAIAGMDHADLVWANTVNDYLARNCR